MGNRTARRLAADPQALLAVGLVTTTLAVAALGRGGDVSRVIAISIEFLAAQAIAAVAAPYVRPNPSQRAMLAFGRFALAILYVTVVTALLKTGEFRPTGALYIPIVALAAAQGTRQAVLVGSAALALYLLPVLSATGDNLPIDAQRAVALGGTAILLSIGTRRSISALTLTVRRLGASLARDRRRSRQVAAVESVGRLLATTGPAAETLERIVGLLRDDLGYDFVSIYLGSSRGLRIAAQAGYDTVIEEFDGTAGVIGRVMRTKQLAFVPDVATDPDYLSASGIVKAEISAPLLVDDELVGMVNVEARATADLDASDVGTMRLVAERMATALALAGERERLAARAELFRRLTSFATAVNAHARPRARPPGDRRRAGRPRRGRLGCLDGPRSPAAERTSSGRSRVAARSSSGCPIGSGVGLAGRAIRDRAHGHRRPLRSDHQPDHRRRAADPSPPMAGVGVPLVRDDVVVGALSLLRLDLARPFTPDELEALPIVAGVVALAITNTFLHVEVTELSVRDVAHRPVQPALSRRDRGPARGGPRPALARGGATARRCDLRSRPFRRDQQAPRPPGRRRDPARLRRHPPPAVPRHGPRRALRRRGVPRDPRRRDARAGRWRSPTRSGRPSRDLRAPIARTASPISATVSAGLLAP